MNLELSPLQVVWEMTRASDAVCEECRKQPSERHPDELTAAEGFRLIEEVKRFAPPGGPAPALVLTGGDPLKRPDLMPLVQYAIDLGIPAEVNCVHSALLDSGAMEDFHRAGVKRIVLRTDSPGAPLAALKAARTLGLGVEMETALHAGTIPHLESIAGVAAQAGVKLWTILFPVCVEPGHPESDLRAAEYEEAFETIWRISQDAPFAIRTANASHYRRFVARKLMESGRPDHPHPAPMDSQREAWELAGVNAGRGLVFISHLGDIHPSGDLGLLAGNVRTEGLVEVYRGSSLFRALRDPDTREGKCGDCEYRCVCGGSRARAFAMTGNFLAEDPRCFYHPGPMPGGQRPVESVEMG